MNTRQTTLGHAETHYAVGVGGAIEERRDGLLRLIRGMASACLRQGDRAGMVHYADIHDALRLHTYGPLD